MYRSGIIIATALLTCSVPAFAEDAAIVRQTEQTAAQPVGIDEVLQPRLAAQRFLTHLEGARIALAVNKYDLARTHIEKAQELLPLVRGEKGATVAPSDPVAMGKVTYGESAENVFVSLEDGQVETGPVQVKTLDTGPFWAAPEGLAVTNAESAYVRLDVQSETVEPYLSRTLDAIARNNKEEAQKELTSLTDKVVEVETSVPRPAEKARDNLSLARGFILRHNYDGARYALRHASDALDSMEKDPRFADKQASIIALRKEMVLLAEAIDSRDPTLAERAESAIGRIGDQFQAIVP